MDERTNETDGFIINGELHRVEDLTFREQRELRTVVRQLADDPKADLDDLAAMDLIPAFVYVVMKRDNASLSLDEVLDMRLSDFMPPEPGSAEERPTKASATSGRRK